MRVTFVIERLFLYPPHGRFGFGSVISSCREKGIHHEWAGHLETSQRAENGSLNIGVEPSCRLSLDGQRGAPCGTIPLRDSRTHSSTDVGLQKEALASGALGHAHPPPHGMPEL